MKAVGIDLAGVETRPTGMCIMDGTMQARTCLLYTDAEILEKTLAIQPDVVAVDAPLALPRGRKSLEKRSSVHLRECDRDLLKMGIRFLPLTLGPMRQLTRRGMRLKTELESCGLHVVETYPGAAQDILHIPRKGKGLEGLRKGLAQEGISGLGKNSTADELDAATCALAGILYLKGEYRALGNEAEMLMILPL